MIHRRPIPKTRQHPEFSQHYDLILDGAVRRYRDGREVCLDNALGRRLYAKRVQEMVQRQNFRCSLCSRRLSPGNATFDHDPRRKMGSAFRDDRIVNQDGSPRNGAAHWVCNSAKE